MKPHLHCWSHDDVFLQHGWTALHAAASYNSVDIVNLLLIKDSTLIKQTDGVSDNLYNSLPM